jgi:hypothetical protein
MPSSVKGALVQLACGLYRALLWVYPAEFRRCYGPEMVRVFGERLKDALTKHGVSALPWFTMHMTWDLLISAVRERTTAVSRVGTLCCVAGLGVGLYAAYVDHHNADEIYPTLSVLLVGSFFLGVVQPAHAWRWALVVAICVPFSPFAQALRDDPTRFVSLGAWVMLLVAMIPAMIGAYAGSTLRSVMRAF